MSLSKMPDINPEIAIAFEDAINSLLRSIALEEMSLSKWLDFETHKISTEPQNETIGKDTLEVNESVAETVQHMLRIEGLLQTQLDEVRKLITMTECEDDGSSTQHIHCLVKGGGQGAVTESLDCYHGETADLYVFAFSTDVNTKSVRYSVGTTQKQIYFDAKEKVKMKSPTACGEPIEIWGKAQLKRKVNDSICDTIHVAFLLTVQRKLYSDIEFCMKIKGIEDEFCHDSGWIKLEPYSGQNAMTIEM